MGKILHLTGHSIGLEIRESSYTVAGNKTPLEGGVVHSVEIDSHIPEKFGVCVEDIVAITKNGSLRFNNVLRELVEK